MWKLDLGTKLQRTMVTEDILGNPWFVFSRTDRRPGSMLSLADIDAERSLCAYLNLAVARPGWLDIMFRIDETTAMLDSGLDLVIGGPQLQLPNGMLIVDDSWQGQDKRARLMDTITLRRSETIRE